MQRLLSFKTIAISSCLFASLGILPLNATTAEVAYIHAADKPSKESRFLAHVIEKPYASSIDIPTSQQTTLPDAATLSQYKVIVLESGGAATTADLEALSQWVEQGGTLIVLAKAATEIGGETWNEAWSRLLGGRGVADTTEGTLKAKENPLFATVKEPYPWMSTGKGLKPLSGATVLVGTDEAALISRHTVGKGTVYYFGHDLASIPATDALLKYSETIIAAVRSGQPTEQPVNREPWGYEPLGEAVVAAEQPPPVKPRPLPALRTVQKVEGKPVVITENGVAKVAIIIPRKARPVINQSAKELAETLKAISGATVPIIPEQEIRIQPDGDRYLIEGRDGTPWESAILIGQPSIESVDVRAEVAQLPLEGFLIRSDRNLIVIAGEDKRPDGFPLSSTAHGVYDFIENQLGVRWLWPGELGRVVPFSPSLAIPPLSITDAPALHVRKLRNGGGINSANYHNPEDSSNAGAKNVNSKKSERVIAALKYLGKEDIAAYAEKHAVVGPWFRQMKMGSNWDVNFTHAFNQWHTLHAKDHPDWFALQPNGNREQNPYRVRLDKQNPELVKAAAKQLLDYYAKHPTADIGSISPNDGGAENTWDMSERSRKHDPVNAPKTHFEISLGGMQLTIPYVSLSDRMVHFGNAVAEEVNKQRPDSKVGIYAYANYRTPPLKGPINPNLVFSFVGTTYFNESDRRKDRASWDGWTRYGNSIMLRPNALLRGNGFPAVFTTKLAEDVKHCYQTGMFGADYDSVTHNWAARGLNYYLLAKLLWNPGLDPESVITDYCQAGFGPAATEMRAYFKELEAITNSIADATSTQIEQELRDEEEEGVKKTISRKERRNILYASYPKAYTPERLQRLKEILAEAKQKAANDPTILKRIDFIESGIAFTELQVGIFAEGTSEKPDMQRLEELLERRNEWARKQFEENFLAVSFLGLGDEQNMTPVRSIVVKKLKQERAKKNSTQQ